MGAKIWVQDMPTVLESSASLVASGCVSASKSSDGYARIVGIAFSSGSSVSGCALFIDQSLDAGANWDFVSACNLSENSASGYSIELVGNAVRVRFHNGADNASAVRHLWRLRPM